MGTVTVNNCKFLQQINGYLNRIAKCLFEFSEELKKAENAVCCGILKTTE